MFAYCVGELRLSEDATYKRIQAARAARQFPAIFDAVADGRLHLTAVVMLKPHLSEATAEDLLNAAANKSRHEIEQLLADRFPLLDLPTQVRAVSPPAVTSQQLVPEPVEQQVPVRIEPPAPRPKLAPIAPERFALQLTMSKSTHDKLRCAQELLSHQLPSGDVAKLLDRALDALIAKLEKRKFAATEKPRAGRGSSNPRCVPAHVRRAVWERDGGRCTFVSESGRRCAARKLLEFDHVDEVARGGLATVEGIRLRCRAHNQYAAERTFGAEFMEQKRHTRAEERAAAKRGRSQEAPSVGHEHSLVLGGALSGPA